MLASYLIFLIMPKIPIFHTTAEIFQWALVPSILCCQLGSPLRASGTHWQMLRNVISSSRILIQFYYRFELDSPSPSVKLTKHLASTMTTYWILKLFNSHKLSFLLGSSTTIFLQSFWAWLQMSLYSASDTSESIPLPSLYNYWMVLEQAVP